MGRRVKLEGGYQLAKFMQMFDTNSPAIPVVESCVLNQGATTYSLPQIGSESANKHQVMFCIHVCQRGHEAQPVPGEQPALGPWLISHPCDGNRTWFESPMKITATSGGSGSSMGQRPQYRAQVCMGKAVI